MEGELWIKTHETYSRIRVKGKTEDVLFSWTALTRDICRRTGIPPDKMAVLLPEMIKLYEKDYLRGFIKLDSDCPKMRRGKDIKKK